MIEQPRIKFKTVQDWNVYLGSLNNDPNNPIQFNPYKLRLACYNDIQEMRGRPIIIYAAKFVNFSANGAPISIDISDVDGFTDMITVIPKEVSEIDVLIHSPGGRPDATERIVHLLRNRFEKVYFLIPHSAYSAATMLALSGNTITMHKSAVLGPIDPQINGNPARIIKKGFTKVRDSVKPETLPAYLPLLEKYSLELLELCDDSERLSKELVKEWLSSYMIPESDETKINSIVDYFSDYDNHLLHSRPLMFDKIKNLGINIEYASDDLNDLLWEAYIVIDAFFNISPFVKLYENTYGISWGRQFMPQIQAIQNKQKGNEILH